jgi:hypothetical protein
VGNLSAGRLFHRWPADQESTTYGVLFMNTESNKILIVWRKRTGIID